MWYEYRCERCGWEWESQVFAKVGEPCIDHDGGVFACEDGGKMIRIFSSEFQTGKPFEPYFNYAVGEWVKDDRHYKSILKRKSAEHTERMQYDINLQPVYPGDWTDPRNFKRLGITEDGEMEHVQREHADKMIAEGKREIKKMMI